MAKKWKDLKRAMPPERQARIDKDVQEALSSMPLAELRKAVGLTQVELAETMKLGQGSVSKIENSTDIYLSTLRRFVESLGGALVIKAAFPDGREMEIGQFSSMLDEESSAVARRAESRRRRSA